MTTGQCETVLERPQRHRAPVAIAEIDDAELLSRFAASRDAMAEIAFEALVRRHGPMVLRVCRQVIGDRHSAEDAFQATFLILARRAGSIRQPHLLGNWLHGVALRTAREARMRDDRRRRRERSDPDSLAVGEPARRSVRPEVESARREQLQALHEEVQRLPERYRIPVLLCDLEGLSQKEAASRLRCPPGTIAVRLMRAREQLRGRLTRRGLAPTAGLLAALTHAEEGSAAMATPLVTHTVRAALSFAEGPGAAAGVVPGPVAALTRAVLRNMAVGRAATAFVVVLATGLASLLLSTSRRDVRVVAASSPPPPPAASPMVDPQTPTPAPAEPSKPRPREVAPDPLDPTKARPPEAIVHAGAVPAKSPAAAPVPPVPDVAPAKVVARRARPTTEEQQRGERLFAKEWVAGDPGSRGGDGLGPVYNDSSCVACHGLGAPGGAGPESKNVVLVTLARNDCGPASSLDRLLPVEKGARTAVLHRYSTDQEYASWRSRVLGDAVKEPAAAPNANQDPAERRIQALQRRMAAGSARQPARQNPQSSMTGATLDFVERNTPPLFGLGRLDEVSAEVLLAMVESQPREVRGRVGRTRDGQVGRFGWKAQVPGLHEFVRVACANELGLEVPGHSQPASPLAPGSKAKGLDLSESDCDALVSYIRTLPAPVVIDPDGQQGNRDLRGGRRLFDEAGCAACHTPSLGDLKGVYSDLLLHDMGQSLSDPGNSYGLDGPDTPQQPSPREWRTPPLWGYRDSGPYLHDGRARDLEEAVALHGGQAKDSAHKFFALSARDRAQVEAFLKSLVAPAAAAPGVVLAAELESRLDEERFRSPEYQARLRREEAAAREAEEFRKAKQREKEAAVLQRARARLPMARSLENMGAPGGRSSSIARSPATLPTPTKGARPPCVSTP